MAERLAVEQGSAARGSAARAPRAGRLVVYGYLAFFFAAFLSLLPYINSDIVHFDEMMLLAEAKRLMAGEVQHRDFFSYYGAGVFSLVVWTWQLAGTISHQSVKLLTYLLTIAGGVMLTASARRLTSRFWLALLPAAFFAVYQAHLFPFSNHHWFGAVASIVFTVAAVRYLFTLTLRDLYLMGAAAAFSLLFIMHEGTVNAAAGAAMAAAAALLFGRRLDACRWPRVALVYVGGFATVMIPVLIWYGVQGLLGEYIYTTFLWPLDNYNKQGNLNDLPWAVDLQAWRYGAGRLVKLTYFLTSCGAFLALLLPVLALLAAALLLTSPAAVSSYLHVPMTAVRDNTENLQARYNYFVLLALTLLAASLYATPLLSQQQFIKLLWGSPRAYLLAVFLIEALWRAAQLAGLRRLVAGLVAFIFLTIGTAGAYNGLLAATGDFSILATPETNRFSNNPIVDLINSETTKDDYIFAYNHRLTMLYFAVEARPATPYTLLHEKYLNARQTEGLFNDLYTKRPKFIAFAGESALVSFAGEQARFAGWLNDNYRLRVRAEDILLYERKP